MVLVINKAPNIKTFQIPNHNDDDLHLLPGANEVSEEWIDLLENAPYRGQKKGPQPNGNSCWLHYRKTGEIRVMDVETEDGDKATGFGDLSRMNVADAVKLVKKTNRLDQLMAWTRVEERKTVLGAIDAKVAKLSPPDVVKALRDEIDTDDDGYWDDD